MLMTIYGRAFKVLMNKPLKLWGVSLLGMFLTGVLATLCGVAIPIVAIAVVLLMSVSMTMIYLHGYRGEEVQCVQLFECFKDFETIKRVLLGMAWMTLWIVLWSLIPIVGPIFAMIRSYEYRLTPYILVTEPEVSITEAIQESKKRTNGYKLQMWLSEFLFSVGASVAFSILSTLVAVLADVPLIGGLFALIYLAVAIVFIALAPLFLGLVQAAFYEEITNPTIPATPQPAPYQQPPTYQPPTYQPPTYQPPAYQQPAQPSYQQPPTYQPPVQPSYQPPVQPSYQEPAQPSYQQPAQPSYQQPAQPSYQQPAQPSYQQPAQPAYQPTARTCARCGANLSPTAKFCPVCGQQC